MNLETIVSRFAAISNNFHCIVGNHWWSTHQTLLMICRQCITCLPFLECLKRLIQTLFYKKNSSMMHYYDLKHLKMRNILCSKPVRLVDTTIFIIKMIIILQPKPFTFICQCSNLSIGSSIVKLDIFEVICIQNVLTYERYLYC